MCRGTNLRLRSSSCRQDGGYCDAWPGYISHKGFFADDGERITIVEFEHEEGLRAWRRNPEHVAAQKLAREKLHRVSRPGLHARPESQFKADEATVPAAPS